jgi:hypothetical protein
MRTNHLVFAFFSALILLSIVREWSIPAACARQAAVLASDGVQVPAFSNYPAAISWQGPAAKVNLKSSEERLFRTNLREAASKPPDFAGHYRFAVWGCGTRCAGGAIVDLQSGNIFAPPLGGKGTGEEHWVFCTDWDKDHGAEYRSDSRLFVLRCGHDHNDHENDVHYLLWEGDHFRELPRGAGKSESREAH